MSDPFETSAASCAMAVMAKASMPGRVKTRLVPPLSREQAADLNTAFLRDIADNLADAGRQLYISPWMAFAPAGSEAFFRSILPSDVGLLETVAANFGDCLFHAIESLLGKGYGSACVINSDSPTLPSGYLVAAAGALSAAGDRVVIGPSTDGGYYLLGLKQAHRRLFDDIDWSTERVLEQTRERAREIGLPVVLLPEWYDVDEAATLRTLYRELLCGEPFREVGPSPRPCRHTSAILSRLIGDQRLATLLESASCAMTETRVA